MVATLAASAAVTCLVATETGRDLLFDTGLIYAAPMTGLEE